MTASEAYRLMDGDFNKIIDLFEDEQIAVGFVKMFLDDKSYEGMMDAIRCKDWELAFRYVHSLKGLCLNMDFKSLARVSDMMTEHIRGGKELKDYNLLESLTEEYNRVISIIEQI